MDAAEAELDIKLQKISGDLIADFDRALTATLRKPNGDGGTEVRSWVRTSQALNATCGVLDMFQELPQLLDAHLPEWIPKLADSYLEYLQIRHKTKRLPRSAHLLSSLDEVICKILYSFCKVRGDKVIVRFLSAEARHLELLLSAIEGSEKLNEDSKSSKLWTWEQRYIVLLWLSHLLLAPFDLSTISSMDIDNEGLPSIANFQWPNNLPGITMRVMPLAIKYLASPGKERDAAKVLLVRVAMRKDMQELGVLDSLVNWALKSLQDEGDAPSQDTYFYLGVLSLLAGLLRASSETSDMQQFLPVIFQKVHSISLGSDNLSKTISSMALARKAMIKIIRVVVTSLLRQSRSSMQTTELTETAIGYMLEQLSDNDTPVRLAASKSLSIIVLKLDPGMASQVVEAVLESLNQNVLWKKSSEAADSRAIRDLSAVNNIEWHGLILTLSHLLYRRSPPASQLPDIIHALLLGLSFEQRGTSGASIGANVRDAACFGIWAVARRYSTEELVAVPTKSVFAAKLFSSSSHIIQVLATELVSTATLDPAGNIRRGASAALQELIGRHPDMVERGIEVVQTVDYHAIARRSRAIGSVAPNVTMLAKQYGEAILENILGWRGVGDMDISSRRDASAAFGEIVASLSFDFSADVAEDSLNSYIQLIIENLNGLLKRQVEERHGLLACFAGILDQIPRLINQRKESGDGDTAINPRFGHEICKCVSAVLHSCKSMDLRRSELITEGASRLVIASLPVLQLVVIPASANLTMCTGHQTLTASEKNQYLKLALAIDSNETSLNADVESIMSTLFHIVPKWLSEKDQDIVEYTSSAALMLLVFSKKETRYIILEEWADYVCHKPIGQSSAYVRGYFYALGMAAPFTANSEQISQGNDVVCKAFVERWAAEDDIEIKVDILKSLMRSRVLQAKPTVFISLLAEGLSDYTTVARGDIGSLVRHQAIGAVSALWKRLDDADVQDTWVESSVQKLIYPILRLSAEKLDRVRSPAQAALALILKTGLSERFASQINSSTEYFEILLSLVSMDSVQPHIAQHVHNDIGSWMSAVMAGYVTSADTGNDALVVASRTALIQFCQTSQHNVEIVCTALMNNLRTRQGEDRLVVPTLEIIAFLFHVGLFQRCRDINLRGLCLQTQKASYKTGNVRKLLACIKVYGCVAALSYALTNDSGNMAGVEEARRRLGALMLHPWPRVRSAVVDELWGLVGDPNTEGREQGELLMSLDWAKVDKTMIKERMKELKMA